MLDDYALLKLSKDVKIGDFLKLKTGFRNKAGIIAIYGYPWFGYVK